MTKTEKQAETLSHRYTGLPATKQSTAQCHTGRQTDRQNVTHEEWIIIR